MLNKSNRQSEMNIPTDSQLESPAQMKVSALVSQLPSDSLSMSWRSQLNEKLRAEQAKKAKATKVKWIWSSSAGLGLAACLALAVMVPRNSVMPVKPQVSQIESGLIGIHTESRALSSVSGTSVNYYETSDASQGDLASPVDADIESL